MGHGDWNDGMNRVGCRGKGESVWLAWFAISCLTAVRRTGPAQGRFGSRSDRLRRQADSLRASVEAHAWDGAWYRRAFFDDGTPLGSSREQARARSTRSRSHGPCSRAPRDPARASQAMEAVDRHLVRPERGLILLFDPPFDDDPRDPGYINGYLPGVRENGGQYTHAAAWVVQATARLGRGRQRIELLEILNPIRPRAGPRGGRSLQGRAVRCRGRRLSLSSPRRAGRMDLVHRLRIMDLPGNPRVGSRYLSLGKSHRSQAVRLARMGSIRSDLPIPISDLPDRCGKPLRGRIRCLGDLS